MFEINWTIEIADIPTEFGCPALMNRQTDGIDDAFILRVPTEILRSTTVTGVVNLPATKDGVIAFSNVCTHMGCLLISDDSRSPSLIDHNRKINPCSITCGPCPCHGTVFDLLKRGLVVIGPASQSLPQLNLQLSEDNQRVFAMSWLSENPSPKVEHWPIEA